MRPDRAADDRLGLEGQVPQPGPLGAHPGHHVERHADGLAGPGDQRQDRLGPARVRGAVRRARCPRHGLRRLAAPADEALRRHALAGDPARAAAQAVLPLPRPRRLRPLPGRTRLRQARGQAATSLDTSSRGTSSASIPTSPSSPGCSGDRPTGPSAPRWPTSSTTSGSEPGAPRSRCCSRSLVRRAARPARPTTATRRRRPRRHRRSPHRHPRAVRRSNRPSSRRTEALMEWVPAPGTVENTVTTNGTWFLTVESSGHELPARRPRPVLRHRQRGRQPDHERPARRRLGGRGPPGPGRQGAVHRRGDRPRRRRAVHRSTRTPTYRPPPAAPGRSAATPSRTRRSGPTATTAWPPWTCRAGPPRSAGAPSRGTASTPRTSPPPAPRCSPSTTRSPSCRTVGTVDGDALEPVPRRPGLQGAGRAQCSATTRRSGRSIPKENNVDAAELFARVGDDYYAPRARHVGHARPVRRRGVLRPRPAARG